MPDIALNHLAVVVDSLDDALGFWCGALGLARAGGTQSITDEGVDVAFLNLGDSHLELIQPTADDSGVARYLAKRGPGLHHFCLEVPDLDSVLQALRDSGVELINEVARERDGRRYAFVHPASASGVLLELYERI
ncbi:MAG: VOC family protein [Chloroflexi bacterium]|nr:VOC family protein [Chloroflexota bacterium]